MDESNPYASPQSSRDGDHADTYTESGRRIVLCIALATIGISVVVIGLYVSANGLATLPPRLVRLALTVILGIFLYRGAVWARWVAVALYGLGSVGSIGVAVPLSSAGHPVNGASLALMGMIYGISALALLVVPAVGARFNRHSSA
jgi:hypothetical protein